MRVFIDESGDAGFKLEEGSSKEFVVSCIIFENAQDVQKINTLINKIREDLGLRRDYEFRFSKS